MYNFFAYMSRMKLIRRWSLMKAVTDENIAEHSAQVAQIAHALAVIANKCYGKSINADRVTTLALYHESSEVITGDLPTPIKYYNPKIREAYKDIESVANAKLLSMLPEKTAVHRMTGDGNKKTLAAPLWSGNKKDVLNFINKKISEHQIR